MNSTESVNTGCSTEILGHLDDLKGHYLQGWCIVDGEPSLKRLVLIADGIPLKIRPIVQKRLDVQEVHDCPANCGFLFNLRSLKDAGIQHLQVCIRNTDFNFQGQTYRYCPRINVIEDTLKAIFNPEFYRHKYNLAQLNNMAAYLHYIKQGIYVNYDPNPWFSSIYFAENHSDLMDEDGIAIVSYIENEAIETVKPCEHFDPAYYAATNPDVDPTLGLLKHYVIHGTREGRKIIDAKIPNHLITELNDLAIYEPGLSTAKLRLNEVVRYPDLTSATYLPQLVLNRYGKEIKAIVCVPFISRGGADLISTFVLKAYEQHYGKGHVLMIVTDGQDSDVPDWIDENSNVVVFDNECNFNNFDEKVFALHHIMGYLEPERIINVNSHTAWEMYRQFGRQLSTEVNLYSYIFCFDFDKDRNKVGYITDYISDVAPVLTSVFCDNQQIINDIGELYGFSKENMSIFEPVYVPLPNGLNIEKREFATRGNGILWIGRLSEQKRPDRLVNIACAMPSKTFYVYGPTGNSAESEKIVNGDYANIEYLGTYDSLNEVDFSLYSAFLNTSEWDGLPTILIQMLSLGIPIVTSSVGGITELIDESNGWLVKNEDDVDEYLTQLKRLSFSTQLRDRKIDKGIKVARERHTWEAFIARLENIGAFSPYSQRGLRRPKQAGKRAA